MFCPRCNAEYVPGFTRCADCDVELVESLPVPAPGPARPEPAGDLVTGDLVTVFSSRDPGLMPIAESLLRSAGIRFSVRGGLVPYATVLPVDLQVLAGDAADARRILGELSAPDSQP
jgi:Putative prokaryotic signal transducing protein